MSVQTILGTPAPLHAAPSPQTTAPTDLASDPIAAEKNVAALSPETRAIARQTVDPAPPATTDTAAPAKNSPAADVDRQPSVAVGRVRSLLKKRPPPDAESKSAAGSPIVGYRSREPSLDAEPSRALPMAATTAAIAAGARAHDPKPAAAAAAAQDDRLDSEEELDNAVLSRDYGHRTTARSHSPAPSTRSKRTVPIAPVPAPRSRSRAASRAPSSRSRPHSRVSTRTGGASIYTTASGTDDAASASSSDLSSDDAAGVASYRSPVSRARRSSMPPSSRRSLGGRSARRSEERTEEKDAETARPHRRAQSVSARSTATRRSVAGGGAFARGAGTIGPGALPDADERVEFDARGAAAQAGLSPRQVKRIGKEERKEGKKLTKILKNEGKVERRALGAAMKELAELQAMQKKAIKDETRAHTAQAKALKAAHDVELVFLEAQRKLQVAQAELRAKQESFDVTREHAQNTTERVQEKNKEVELLRAQKGADSREREAKMRKLVGKV